MWMYSQYLGEANFVIVVIRQTYTYSSWQKYLVEEESPSMQIRMIVKLITKQIKDLA